MRMCNWVAGYLEQEEAGMLCVIAVSHKCAWSLATMLRGCRARSDI